MGISSAKDNLCESLIHGYDGLELGLPDHLDVSQTDMDYYNEIKAILHVHDFELFCILQMLLMHVFEKKDKLIMAE